MNFENLIYSIPVILFAVTFHEFAHGYVAWYFGDPTARNEGRLTLNPLKHLDVLGTLTLVITQMIGWAKPVPVNPRYFRNPRRDMVYVALAGPASNILLAIVSVLIFHAMKGMSFQSETALSIASTVFTMVQISVLVNVALAVFNMIPLLPLDGGRILYGMLPPRQAYEFGKIEPYGFFIILALVFLGLTQQVIRPIINTILTLFGVY
ncbi:site-2 protease family protein [Chrysiogenes arsenatis]|uniref:site-2 protease family protein n=1 Tax=Chrysiogenes arsenatis TaxID=309797 RepID=UPI0003FE274E|nr:site-2 protease family protein [Chrysiogenes arsenatis]